MGERAQSAMVMLSACIAAAPAHAAETPITRAPPVIVTDTRIDESAARMVGARLITAREIERSGASTLSELLRSSFEVRTRNLPGSPNPQIDLRGFGLFGEHNTLVLIDGLRAREYELLTVNWAAIPLSSIQRIEILPASSAVLYGGGATGGTINIVTKAPASGARSAELGAELGTHDTLEARAVASAAGRNAGLRLHGSHYESDNYRDNQRVRIDNAQADVRWTGESGSLSLKLGADDQRFGLPGVISEAQIAANPRQAARLRDFGTQRGGYLSLGAHTKFGPGDLTAYLGYRERDTSQHILVGTPFGNSVDTQVSLWTFAPRMQFRPEFGSWENALVVGADFEDWKFDSNSGPTIVGRPHSTQRTAALYAQHAMTFATRTTLTLGARGQRARYDVMDRVNPAASGARRHTLRAWDVSARQALWPALNVYGRRGNSFRLPNVSDNFNPAFARVTLLEPQTARDMEFGLDGAGSAWRYRAAVFRVDLSNELFFDPVTLGSRNRQPTRRQGFSVEGSWQATASLALRANYTYADATFREGTVGGQSIAGNRVPISPRHTLNTGFNWALSSRARADFDVHYTGTSAFDADETNTFGREIPAYTVADLKLSARRGDWLLKAGIRNLFNEKYIDYAVVTRRPTYLGRPAAARTLFVAAQYTFR
ncbi:MAG: TonB-dependent receptor [Betaproteobacteria bacterium]